MVYTGYRPESYRRLALSAAKRALWCRWFHRWHPRPYWGGWMRTTCAACEDFEYGERRTRRKL